mmetsp:Transcript_1363/g.3211  ORF Transcript_1363/g.3211 Transcript_1363/m.3211 type:complete len:276 (-) Transcript_1363:2005-2832(-)
MLRDDEPHVGVPRKLADLLVAPRQPLRVLGLLLLLLLHGARLGQQAMHVPVAAELHHKAEVLLIQLQLSANDVALLGADVPHNLLKLHHVRTAQLEVRLPFACHLLPAVRRLRHEVRAPLDVRNHLECHKALLVLALAQVHLAIRATAQFPLELHGLVGDSGETLRVVGSGAPQGCGGALHLVSRWRRGRAVHRTQGGTDEVGRRGGCAVQRGRGTPTEVGGRGVELRPQRPRDPAPRASPLLVLRRCDRRSAVGSHRHEGGESHVRLTRRRRAV